MPSADARRWQALALLCVASFMVILDASIVITAVPSIQNDLGFAGGDVQWVMTAYVVTFGGLLLFGGRTADLLGRRRVFMSGVGLFVVTSLLCGLAVSPGALIGFRALQGVAAAVMTPSAFSIVLNLFPEGSDRNRAIGVWGAVAGMGGTAGSCIGGPLTGGLGWEWIFFINVPVGLALLLFSPMLLKESRTNGSGLDIGGALSITAALVLLVYAVAQAPRSGWSGVGTTGPLLLAAALVGVFVRIEKSVAAPLVPLQLLRSRTLVGGNLVGLVAGMAAFGQGFILTEYGQQVLGWSPAKYGIASAVMPIMAVVGSIVGQHVVTRVGFRSVALTGMVLMAAGCLLWSGVPADGGFVRDLLPGMLVFGPGLGAGTVAASIAAVSGVSEVDSGLAAGINNASFQIGGALGVAVLASVTVSQQSAGVTGGFHAALLVAIGFPAAGFAAALLLMRRAQRPGSVEPTAVPAAD